ncbi:MAG: pilin [Patescibacteria group bacterium]
MKKIFVSVLISITFLAIAVVAMVAVGALGAGQAVFAQGTPAKLEANPANLTPDKPGEVGSNNPLSPLFQLVSCRGIDDPRTAKDDNQLDCDYKQLVATVSRLIQFALYILIPIVLGMIIYIGFKYLTSSGDSAKLADAKRMIIPLLTGIFLIFSAWLIVYTFLDKLLVDKVSENVKKSDIVPAGIK